jgi:hypothetical protein
MIVNDQLCSSQARSQLRNVTDFLLFRDQYILKKNEGQEGKIDFFQGWVIVGEGWASMGSGWA